MTVFVVSWTIEISSSNNEPLIGLDVSDFLKGYPAVSDHHPKPPVVEIITDGDDVGMVKSSGQISFLKRSMLDMLGLQDRLLCQVIL